MNCAVCNEPLGSDHEAFTGDVCPHCQHFAHPTRLGIYENLELVKRGGMGSVYRARHPKLGTTVAIKVVHSTLAPDIGERFDRETQMAGRIPHPGVVRVYDSDVQEGRLYLVMEFVDGQTLRQSMQSGSHDVAWSIDKIAQLADVLHAAHEQGIVHRDIKPENVMVDPTGRVRVLDFGISRLLSSEEQLTRTGEILGTPEYISPEQILDVAESVDARTDVYAAGVVLYETLTGRSPFAGSNLFQVLKFVESRTPPPPSELVPGIDAELDELVMTAMSKDKADRPRDAHAFALRLRELAPSRVPIARRRLSAGWIVIVFAALAASFWFGRETSTSIEPKPRILSAANQTIEILSASGAQRLDSIAKTEQRTLEAELQQVLPKFSPTDVEQHAQARGAARKHCGDLFGARRDLEPSVNAGTALSDYERTLHPLLMGVPKSLVRPPSAISLDRSKITEGLASISPPDRSVLRGLIDLYDGDSDSARLRVEGSHYPPAEWLRAATLPVDARIEAIRALRNRQDRRSSTRYMLELAIACLQRDLGRMRAAAELASMSGAGQAAVRAFATARLALAETGSYEFALDEPALARLCVAMARTGVYAHNEGFAQRFAERIADRLRDGSNLDSIETALERAALPPSQTRRLGRVLLDAACIARRAGTQHRICAAALRVARTCGVDLDQALLRERYAPIRETLARVPEDRRDG